MTMVWEKLEKQFWRDLNFDHCKKSKLVFFDRSFENESLQKRGDGFFSDPFPKWPIPEVTHFRLGRFQSDCNHDWFRSDLFHEVTFFRIDLFPEVTNFQRDRFWNDPFFEVTYFRNDRDSMTPPSFTEYQDPNLL